MSLPVRVTILGVPDRSQLKEESGVSLICNCAPISRNISRHAGKGSTPISCIRARISSRSVDVVKNRPSRIVANRITATSTSWTITFGLDGASEASLFVCGFVSGVSAFSGLTCLVYSSADLAFSASLISLS